MGMFTRLFGGPTGAIERSARAARAANLVAPQTGLPSFAVALPRQLNVDFHAHDNLDGVAGNFITAVSDGLKAHRQRELVFSLRLGNREDPIAKMQQLILFFTTVYAWASEGNLVEEGSFTRFGERGLFQREQSGLVYAAARALPGVTLPERALAAILVDAAEIRAAVDFGTYRVLSRIGFQLRLFPYPSWSALDRPSAMTPREGETQLAKYGRLRAPSVSFLVEARCLRLRIRGGAARFAKVLQSVPPGASFVLLTQPEPSANAILVWRPGQEGTRGFSPDGSDRSRLSGSCLRVIPSATENRASEFEDGYSLQLRPDSWARLASACIEQRAFSLDLEDGIELVLDWPGEPE